MENEEISDLVAEKDDGKIQSEENGSITVNFYGIKAEYKLQGTEAGKMKKMVEMLQIQRNFNEAGFIDALRKTRIVGLGEKIAEVFDKAVSKEKKEALFGIAASVSLYLMARYFDMGPIAEKIAYVGSIIGGIGNTLVYAKAYITGHIVNSYLREEL